MTDFDILIVGAGIAGVSLAAELAKQASILLIETEAQPGYHATGRSVAFWTESYGGPGIQPLTTASGPFLANPPIGLADRPMMTRRGALHIGKAQDTVYANKLLRDFGDSGIVFEAEDRAAIEPRIPGIRKDWNQGIWEPTCCDIDVASLQAVYLGKARRGGVKLLCNAPFRKARFAQGIWQIETAAGHFTAKKIVNAAGAWADDVAVRADVKPIGITPFRRTVLQLAVQPRAPPTLPLVIALDGSFYFKPDAGKVWLSPHDETPSPACDAAPHEIDVAIAIERFEAVVDWRITKLEHKWAGLRSFAPDRLPVIGPDRGFPEFFWFAGQGGFGIQTAPAAAKLAASLLCDEVSALTGIDGSLYLPSRLH
jgi:D-arginine dehydrogenase